MPPIKLSYLAAGRSVGRCLTALAVSCSCWLVAESAGAEDESSEASPTKPTSGAPSEGSSTETAPSRAGEPESSRLPGSNAADADQVSASEADALAVERYLQGHPAQDCRPLGVWSSAARIWVACGAAGYLVFQRAAEGLIPIETRRVEGEVTGFFLQDGRVWARILQERAVVVGRSAEVARSPAPGGLPRSGVRSRERAKPAKVRAGTEPAASPVTVIGEVTAVNRLEAEINIGENAGLKAGAHVALSERSVGEASGKHRPAVIVGKVVDVDEDSARVRIGLNESVSVSSTARLTDEPLTASRVAPERSSGVWELRGMARPLLSLGAFGGGVLAELEGGYRTDHFHLGARTGPLGVAGASESDTVSTWGGYVYGAYDSWVFSAGLGVGAQSVNDTDGRSDKGTGLSLTQLLRLGAVDGLHLSSRTHAVVFRSETQFAGLEMQGQISVSREAWLILRGGGNVSGYGYGEVAIRNLLDGNGGRGSFFLEVSVGGAAIFQDFCATGDDAFSFACSTESIGGPLIGIGGEWRL